MPPVRLLRQYIAVIDDDSFLRQGVMTSLNRDYQMIGFAKAESAIEAMQKEVPDLVLLDINLPGMNGMEALKKIRIIRRRSRSIPE